jgi:hypothetical protein
MTNLDSRLSNQQRLLLKTGKKREGYERHPLLIWLTSDLMDKFVNKP